LPCESKQTALRRLVAYGDNLRSSRREVRSHRQQQWACTRNQDALSGDWKAAARHRVQSSGAKDSRQRPSRERKKQLACTGGENQPSIAKFEPLIATLCRDNAAARMIEDPRATQTSHRRISEIRNPLLC
jgi:hypothetical protein